MILTASFPPEVGGIGTFAVNLARGLQTAGHDVRVVTSVPCRGGEQVDGVPVSRTAGLLNRKVLKLAPMLGAAWWLQRQRPYSLVAMTWTHEGLVARLMKILFGLRYVVVTHGSEIAQHRRRWPHRPLMLWTLRGAYRVVANSTFTERLVISLGIPAEHVCVVNPPVAVADRGGNSDRAGIDEKFALTGKRVILTAARLVRRKGSDDRAEPSP